ncbi:MAG: T9SS type A sorting domain-containing protein, partial [Ignavibacteriaceae bacterium]
PKDSVGITFSIFPSIVRKTILNIFQPALVVDSKFSIGKTHFTKTIKFQLTGITDAEKGSNTPDKFYVSQNFPNPFNPSTLIEYSLAKTSFVNLTIFNVLGEKIKNLIDKEQASGIYQINFDASSLPSGIYFYRIEAGNFVEIKKMVLLR